MSLQLYQQCAGAGFYGTAVCQPGLVCLESKSNPGVSHCLNKKKCHKKPHLSPYPLTSALVKEFLTSTALSTTMSTPVPLPQSSTLAQSAQSSSIKCTTTTSNSVSTPIANAIRAPASNSSSETLTSTSSVASPAAASPPPSSGSDFSVKSIGPVMQGKSTRYFDCCKPSCSWSGKANVDKPVNSCGKDGTTIAPADTANACTGGNSFTCNSNQPFAINSTVAMGFAAASIQGLSEGDRCCACYKLDFNSGPVAGKSMIVQVTNSGGDLGENQFDIQIPGGGVGLFNGCTPQWGAPGEGWGAKMGGVSDSSACSQLPKELQEGCKFRFGSFFQGADNPTLSFQRVQCPAELIKRSGCKRNDE